MCQGWSYEGLVKGLRDQVMIDRYLRVCLIFWVVIKEFIGFFVGQNYFDVLLCGMCEQEEGDIGVLRYGSVLFCKCIGLSIEEFICRDDYFMMLCLEVFSDFMSVFQFRVVIFFKIDVICFYWD